MASINDKLLLNPFLQPNNSPVGSPQTSKVAWKFGIQQKIQAKKIRATSGAFNNISGTLSSNQGTISSVIFQNGTVLTSITAGGTIQNVLITGATDNNPIIGTPAITGGTINAVVVGTPSITGGTINNATLGTPSVTGGTLNPGVYQASGTAGATGSIVYLKTTTPTFGTVSFANGLIIAFN